MRARAEALSSELDLTGAGVFPAMELQPKQRLEQRCSPMQIAFAQLLALDTASFEDSVAVELDANPALERLDVDCQVCGGVVGGSCCRPSRGSATLRSDAPGDDCEWLPSAVSLHEVLLADIRPMLPAKDAEVAEHLVYSLDEHGLLDEPPARLAARLGVAGSRVERALAALRAITCPGAGASSVREHLLLELDALDVGPVVRMARSLVEHHLEAIASGDLAALADSLAVDADAIAAARELIRSRLHLYPILDQGRSYTTARVQAVPDLAIVITGDGYPDVRVLEADRVRLRVSESFERVACCDDGPGMGGGLPEVRTAVAAARDFIQRVHRRWGTMRAVGLVVAEHQHDFLLHGRAALRPLTRAAVAAAIGVHESTVGRAVKDRHVLLPSGRVVPFTDFFPVSVGTRDMLSAIVARESRPLTDAELVRELGRRGHHVARRTIVKYRQQLGIVCAAQRR